MHYFIKLKSKEQFRLHFNFVTEGNYELRLLTVALLLNPYMKTFWNRRRKLVLSGDLDPYSELRYVVLILTYKPKIQDVFTYRKWLLQRIFESIFECISRPTPEKINLMKYYRYRTTSNRKLTHRRDGCDWKCG